MEIEEGWAAGEVVVGGRCQDVQNRWRNRGVGIVDGCIVRNGNLFVRDLLFRTVRCDSRSSGDAPDGPAEDGSWKGGALRSEEAERDLLSPVEGGVRFEEERVKESEYWELSAPLMDVGEKV